ncbi:hypothetical protein L7F22_000315 [Adiantum nelumboides]|nr:hypothetical protein [Adiantum nelumboides]
MRGQAFVAFDSKEPAAKAVSEVVGFPLYGKPMAKSDSVVALGDDKDGFEEHKKQRKEHKIKQRREYFHQKRLAKRAAEMDGDDAATAAPKRQELQMPDEYLPPNKILFLHNVPDRVSRDDLDALFRSDTEKLRITFAK